MKYKRKDYKAKIKKKAAMMLIMTLMIMENCVVCFASNAEAEEAAKEITGPMGTLLLVFISIFQVLGGFLLLKGISEAATAWKQSDDTGLTSALKSIVSGLILVFLKLIMKLLGIEV